MNSNTEPGHTHKPRSPYKTTLKRAKLAGILCIIIVCVAIILMSPIFSIKSIVVEGNNKFDDTEIIKAAGISKGDSIFSVRTEHSAEKIAQLGRIGNVSITRVLPSKIVIDINERSECAYIKEKGTYTGIDENGRIMITGAGLDEKVPVIYGVKLVDSEKGQFMKIDSKNASELSGLVTRMLTELKNQGIISEIESIDLANLSDIHMTLTNETLVNLGKDGDEDGDNIEYKIAYLKVIIPELPESQVGGVIELSDTENVTSSISGK
ncbi:MAG: FtsQ-type POTRA domain-containing protein [Clostridia bacterium]|nr:FtsQ-type POTRA domain-containing protein [Clostridia bacterium]